MVKAATAWDSPPATQAAPPPGMRRRVAVVGSGISGLAVAHTLVGLTDTTLFEAGDYFGGHTHTVDVALMDMQGVVKHFGVDTGFLVLNERTYPNLLALFEQLGVPVAKSEMSFSVRAPGAGVAGGPLEWSGSNLSTLFAQRGNLLNPRFWGMVRDILRFNRLCTRLAAQQADLLASGELLQPLGQWLDQQGFSTAFRDWYFLPMMGCIWSCPTDQMLAFPVATMVRFCHNHGLIQVTNRPQWYTVPGGARQYVEKMLEQVPSKHLNTPVRHVLRDADGVRIVTDDRVEHFDAVVLACHSDQALALLGDAASAPEREVLGAIRYQPNLAVLHTDTSVLPRTRRAWAAWNYERSAKSETEAAGVCLHYLINRLQPLPVEQPVVVSLNPQQPIDQDKVLGSFDYAHPVFDLAALQAQQRLPGLQGQQHTWFAGAWMGYGFHEDGLKAGLQAARGVIERLALAPATAKATNENAAPEAVA